MTSGILQESLSSSLSDNGTLKDLTPLSGNALQDAVNAVIACLAVLGNGMVIWVMLVRRRVFKSFTNRLIMHQSVIDLIGGVLFFIHHVVKGPDVPLLDDNSVYDQLACRLWYADILLWWVNVTSTYNLAVISLERLMATCYPVKYRNEWYMDKLKYAVAVPWGIGLLHSSRFILLFEVRQGYCEFVKMTLGLNIFLSVFAMTVDFIVPLIIMAYSYQKIFAMLRQKLGNQGNIRQNTLSRAKKNVLVTILLAVVMFVICWTPVEVQYMTTLLVYTPLGDVAYKIATSLLACNSFVNPIIYSLKYDHFRNQLKRVLQITFRRYRIHSDHSTEAVASNDPLQYPASTHTESNI